MISPSLVLHCWLDDGKE